MKVLITEKISEHKSKDNSGYLICNDCICARTGTQTYTRDECFGDGDMTEIEVDRKEEDVFDEKALASFENKPLTIQHPSVDVTPDNYKELAVGYARDIHKGTYEGKPVMMANIVVTDPEAIRLVESGELTNLSCGYDCDVEDCDHPCQKNIRGNHIALCDIPRAGNTHIQDSHDNKPTDDMRQEYVYGVDNWIVDEAVEKARTLALEKGAVRYGEMIRFIESLSPDLSKSDCLRVYDYVRRKYDKNNIFIDGRTHRTTKDEKYELSTISNVHAEDITYEGDDEPDIAWLHNRYNVNISYDGDTKGTYTIKGEEKDIDRFARDHHLTRDSRRKNDEKPLHIRSLEKQVSKNVDYRAMAELACKGNNDLYDLYFYAFKDAYERNGYKPTDDDIQGELRDAFYQEMDVYQDGHGLTDKEMGDFGMWDFEEDIGVTEDEFIDNGMNAYFGIVSKNKHDSKGKRIPRREHDSIIKKAKRDSTTLLGNDVIEVVYDLSVKAETQKEKADIIKFLEKNNITFEEEDLYLTIYFDTIEKKNLFYKNLMNDDSEE